MQRKRLMTLIFETAFSSKRKADADLIEATCQAPPPPHGADPDAEVNDMLAARLKSGKYRTATIKTLKDSLWHVLVDVMHESRGPLDHAHNFLSKDFSHDEVIEDGTNMTRLVCGKALALFREFEQCLDTCQEHLFDVLPLTGTVQYDLELEFARFNTVIVLHNASGFDRRLLRTTLEMPLLILWLSFSARSVPCQHRKRIAIQILNTPDDELEITARKIKKTSHADLVQASIYGTTGIALWLKIKMIAVMICGDSADLESTNNILKTIGKRAPRITLELMNARMAAKKKLLALTKLRQHRAKLDEIAKREQSDPANTRAEGKHVKQSAGVNALNIFKDVATTMHSDLLTCATDPLPANLAGVPRFGPPAPLTGLPSPEHVAKTMLAMYPCMRKTPEKKYGAAYSILWHKAFPKSDLASIKFLLFPNRPRRVQLLAQCLKDQANETCTQGSSPMFSRFPGGLSRLSSRVPQAGGPKRKSPVMVVTPSHWYN